MSSYDRILSLVDEISENQSIASERQQPLVVAWRKRILEAFTDPIAKSNIEYAIAKQMYNKRVSLVLFSTLINGKGIFKESLTNDSLRSIFDVAMVNEITNSLGNHFNVYVSSDKVTIDWSKQSYIDDAAGCVIV